MKLNNPCLIDVTFDRTIFSSQIQIIIYFYYHLVTDVTFDRTIFSNEI